MRSCLFFCRNSEVTIISAHEHTEKMCHMNYGSAGRRVAVRNSVVELITQSIELFELIDIFYHRFGCYTILSLFFIGFH